MPTVEIRSWRTEVHGSFTTKIIRWETYGERRKTCIRCHLPDAEKVPNEGKLCKDHFFEIPGHKGFTYSNYTQISQHWWSTIETRNTLRESSIPACKAVEKMTVNNKRSESQCCDEDKLTPSHVKWPSSGKRICNYLDHILATARRRQWLQQRLHSRGPDAKENEDVDNQELVIAHEEHIVKSRASRDQMEFFCDEQEYRRN